VLPLAQLYLMLDEPKKLLDSIQIDGLPVTQHAELLTLRGAAHGMLGNNALAAQSYAAARTADPRSVAPLLAEVPLHLRAGERDKARAAAAKAVALAPESAAAWHIQGVVLQEMGDIPGALAAQDRAIKLDPKSVDARVARASLLVGLDRDEQAEQEITQFASLALIDPRASYLRGLLAQRKGDQDAAKKAFGEAVGLIDSLPPGGLANSEQVLMTGALAHRALDNREKAQSKLEILLKFNPRHSVAQLLLASMMLEARDYTRATTLLEAAQRANPNDPHVLFQLGQLRLDRKQYLQANQLFEQAVARSNDPTILRALGVSQLSIGQNQRGLASLEQVLAANPSDQKTAVQLALSYGSLGQYDKALKTAEAIVQRSPDNLTMLNFLGNVRGRSGDKRGARAAFQQVLTKSPTFTPAAINLSWLDIEERRFDEARQRLTQMLAQAKSDPGLMFQLGVLERRAGRPDDALRHWTRANELQRSDPRAAFAIVDLYSSQQQTAKALEAAKSLASAYPDNLQARLALGRSYLAAEDRVMARSIFKEATVRADFDADQQVQIGRLQLQAGSADDAAYNVQKALQAQPDDIEALVLQVELEFKRGSAAQVDAALKTLAAKHPASERTVMTQAHVAMARGQFAAAVAGYRSAMDKAASTPTAILLTRAHIAAGQVDKALSFMQTWSGSRPQDGGALRGLAQVQIQAGKHEDARASFKKILAATPQDPAALASYAQLLQLLGDPAAVPTAQKALQLAPAQAEYADLLGWMLVQGGQTEEGLRHLREARLRQPENGQIRYHLAQALSKAGRQAEARDELKAALAAPIKLPMSPEVAKLKSTLGL